MDLLKTLLASRWKLSILLALGCCWIDLGTYQKSSREVWEVNPLKLNSVTFYFLHVLLTTLGSALFRWVPVPTLMYYDISGVLRCAYWWTTVELDCKCSWWTNPKQKTTWYVRTVYGYRWIRLVLCNRLRIVKPYWSEWCISPFSALKEIWPPNRRPPIASQLVSMLM